MKLFSFSLPGRIFLIASIFTLIIGAQFVGFEDQKVYASQAASQGKILFVSKQLQGSALHIIDPVTAKEDMYSLGSSVIFLGAPVWSPRCDRILTNLHQTDEHILGSVAYDVNGLSTGSLETEPTELSGSQPSWSPDGISITFQAGDAQDRFNSDIYTLSTATGSIKKLTNDPVQSVYPSWSPDGQQIVFTTMSLSSSSDYFDIYTINSDGSSLKVLYTDPETNKFMPLWSPDGNFIAFVTQASKGDHLMVTDKDGISSTTLVDDPTYKILHYAWSNDGNYIALTANRANNDAQILLLNISSKSIEPLTDLPETINMYASWSPDDSQIVFQSNRDRDVEIYTLDLATRTVSQLTDNDYLDGYPVWSPKSCFEN